MRKTILALVALVALAQLTGCDPFGSDETMTFITGHVYADSGMTSPAEGVLIELLLEPDSTVFTTQTVTTNSSGEFLMEIQFLPIAGDPDAGTGYSLPTTGTAGLAARYGSGTYVYKSATDGFVLTAGDTLEVWDISLYDISGGGSK